MLILSFRRWNGHSSFCNCSKTKWVWCTVIKYFKRNLHNPPLTQQSAILGFLEPTDKVFLILNTKSSFITFQICLCLKKFKRFFLLKPSWNPSWKYIGWKQWKRWKEKKTIYRKIKTNFLKTLRRYEVSRL